MRRGVTSPVNTQTGSSSPTSPGTGPTSLQTEARRVLQVIRRTLRVHCRQRSDGARGENHQDSSQTWVLTPHQMSPQIYFYEILSEKYISHNRELQSRRRRRIIIIKHKTISVQKRKWFLPWLIGDFHVRNLFIITLMLQYIFINKKLQIYGEKAKLSC